VLLDQCCLHLVKWSIPLVLELIPMHKPVQWARTLNSITVSNFSQMYKNIFDNEFLDSSLLNIDLDEHLYHFNSTCISFLDSVASLKPKRLKKKTEPWLKETVRSFRRLCRQAERRWRKHRLQVYYKILRCLI